MRRRFWAVAGALLAGSAAPAQVVLSEVMWNPATAEQHDEYVELDNRSDAAWVDLSGWHLGDGDELDALVDAGDGLVLPPGARALVLDGSYGGSSTTYDSLRGRVFMLTIEDRAFGRGGWSNSAPEAVILCDAAGETVDVFQYEPVEASGRSWERLDGDAGGGSGEWTLSAAAGGTPGRPNSVAALVPVAAARLEVGPDPFADRLEIAVLLPATAGLVSLRIYDVEGRLVRRLLTDAAATQRRDLVWDGTDGDGRQVLPGLYVVVLEASAEGRLWRDRRVVARLHRP